MTKTKKNKGRNNSCEKNSVREVFTDNQARGMNRQHLTEKEMLEVFSNYSREFLDYKAMFPNFSVPFKEETRWKTLINEISSKCSREEVKDKIIETIEEECDIEIKDFMQKEGVTGLDSLRKTLADSCRLIYVAEIYGYIRRADIPLDNIIAKIADKY